MIDASMKSTDALALAAEARALDTLLKAEKRYLKAAEAGGSKADLRTAQAEIDNLLKRAAGTWAKDVVPPAFDIAQERTARALLAARGVDPNVNQLLTIYKNFDYDADLDQMTAGSRNLMKDAFETWNKDTAKWLGDVFEQARRDGVPVGSYSDIGKDKDTLISRLCKAPGRLKGTMIDTVAGPRHYPAELTALNLARTETVRIENKAAEVEADKIGLEYCYNANPDDANTTPICHEATQAGVLPRDEMEERFGIPPRLSPFYHLCRSKLIFVRPEWVE